MIGDQRYMAVEAGPLDRFNHSFSIMVECDDQAEVDRPLCMGRTGLQWAHPGLTPLDCK